MTEHKPLPVAGYTTQSDSKVDLVNEGKQLEERVMRYLDKIEALGAQLNVDWKADTRWLAIGRTHIQQGFMATFRAVFQPTRIKLPEDE